MNVTEACQSRISVRAFKSDPVAAAVVREILEIAGRGAASGGNLQPWRVYALTGRPLEAFKREVVAIGFEGADYAVYPPNLWDPFRSRRYECGEDLYATIGIAREDKPARLRQLKQNASFFGAPVGMFFCIDRNLGSPQWADLGMYMQSVMLLAVERGLDTCAQEFWAAYPKTIARVLELPDDHMVFAGMALGYRDAEHPINGLRTRREPFDNFARMIGFLTGEPSA
jgi:nitroreductase